MKHTSPAHKSGKRELRTYTAASPLEVRTTADGHKQVSGYAIVFNSKSVDLGGFTEICSPSMLDRTLKESPDILLLRDHKQELLLGRTTAGTLELKTDARGLAFTVTLPKSAIGDDTAENVRLGNLTGCSFGFVTVSDDWVQTEDSKVVRTLLDIDLFEISITSFPHTRAPV
jgi:HK97 family phage prohead protease